VVDADINGGVRIRLTQEESHLVAGGPRRRVEQNAPPRLVAVRRGDARKNHAALLVCAGRGENVFFVGFVIRRRAYQQERHLL